MQCNGMGYAWVTEDDFTYASSQNANNKCADQSARMRRLICAFVVPKPHEDRFCRVTAHYVTGTVFHDLTICKTFLMKKLSFYD